MFEKPEFYIDASPLGKLVLIAALIAGLAQLLFLIALPFVRRYRRQRRLARQGPSKRERIEAMVRAEDEAARRDRRRNEPAPLRGLRRMVALVTPRGLWHGTRRPSAAGMVIDVIGLAAFALVVVLALQRVAHWSEPVPLTKAETIHEHEHVEFRAPDNRPVFYTEQFFEVANIGGECCDRQSMAQLPQSELGDGYKLVVLGEQQMWPDSQRRHANGRLQCDATWRQAGYNNLAVARVMATVEHLEAPFDIDVWYVNTTRPLRPGDLYMAPPFQRACAQPGGCFSKYLLAGKPSIGVQEHLVYEGRLSGAEERSAEEFMRVINGGRPRRANGAYIVDPQGRVRAEIEQVGDTSTLDVISAVFRVARADGRELPENLLAHFRVDGSEAPPADQTRYFEQRVEDDAGVAPAPTYSGWLERFNTSGMGAWIPGTAILGDWAQRAPALGNRLGLGGLPPLAPTAAVKPAEEGNNDV